MAAMPVGDTGKELGEVEKAGGIVKSAQFFFSGNLSNTSSMVIMLLILTLPTTNPSLWKQDGEAVSVWGGAFLVPQVRAQVCIQSLSVACGL